MSDPNTDQNPYMNGELPADADLNDETTGETGDESPSVGAAGAPPEH